MLKKYLINILISIDQFFNALLLGDPDETISSRLGKSRPNGLVCRSLDKLDPDHCADAIEPDEGSDSVFKTNKENKNETSL